MARTEVRVGHIDEDLDTGGERDCAGDMIRFVSGLAGDEYSSDGDAKKRGEGGTWPPPRLIRRPDKIFL
jgi:hypothetical protein